MTLSASDSAFSPLCVCGRRDRQLTSHETATTTGASPRCTSGSSTDQDSQASYSSRRVGVLPSVARLLLTLKYCLRTELDGGGSGPGTSGCWDSLHVFEVSERGGGRSASYNLTSTVMLSLGRKEAGSGTTGELGTLDLAGSLTRQTNGDHSVADAQSHIANMGRMVEDMEAKIRNSLQEVYFGKTKDIVGQLRSPDSLERQRQAKDLQKELMNLWKK